VSGGEGHAGRKCNYAPHSEVIYRPQLERGFRVNDWVLPNFSSYFSCRINEFPVRQVRSTLMKP
jgi:hypothetical protein